MKCSSCKVGTLEPAYFEGLFACHSCSHCGGDLILLGDYIKWQSNNVNDEIAPEASVDMVAQETSRAMVCPLSGTLMTKYRIADDTEHRLDLSPAINAVWLDKGEWNLLKEKGLANKLATIFTNHWQRSIIAEERSALISDINQEKFGDKYKQINEFKALISELPNRSEVIAYLLAD